MDGDFTNQSLTELATWWARRKHRWPFYTKLPAPTNTKSQSSNRSDLVITSPGKYKQKSATDLPNAAFISSSSDDRWPYPQLQHLLHFYKRASPPFLLMFQLRVDQLPFFITIFLIIIISTLSYSMLHVAERKRPFGNSSNWSDWVGPQKTRPATTIIGIWVLSITPVSRFHWIIFYVIPPFKLTLNATRKYQNIIGSWRPVPTFIGRISSLSFPLCEAARRLQRNHHPVFTAFSPRLIW